MKKGEKIELWSSDTPAVHIGDEECPYKSQYVRGVFVWTCPKCEKKISSKSFLNWGYFELAVEHHQCRNERR